MITDDDWIWAQSALDFYEHITKHSASAEKKEKKMTDINNNIELPVVDAPSIVTDVVVACPTVEKTFVQVTEDVGDETIVVA